MRAFHAGNVGNAVTDIGSSDVIITAESADYGRVAVTMTSNTSVVASYDFWRAGARSNWWNTNTIAATAGIFTTPVLNTWQFNHALAFSKVLIQPYNGALTNSIKTWTMQGSDNGTDWVEIGSYSSTFPTFTDYTFNIATVRRFYYYRMRITEANRSTSITLIHNKIWLLQ